MRTHGPRRFALSVFGFLVGMGALVPLGLMGARLPWATPLVAVLLLLGAYGIQRRASGTRVVSAAIFDGMYPGIWRGLACAILVSVGFALAVHKGHVSHLNLPSVTPTITSIDDPRIQAFLNAERLPSTQSSRSTPPVPEWNHVIRISKAVSLRVQATRTVGGRFVGRYSDESTPRDLGTPGDYILPVDLRVDHARGHLYCLASGRLATGGNQIVMVLFMYDLKGRGKLESFVVAPKVLPEAFSR